MQIFIYYDLPILPAIVAIPFKNIILNTNILLYRI